MADNGIRLEAFGVGGWRLTGEATVVADANAYLGYLQDRNYSPRTVRAYGYGLVAFCRWLQVVGLTPAGVVTDDVLGFLSACRQEQVPGRPWGRTWSTWPGSAPTGSRRRRSTCAWPPWRGCTSSG